LLGVVVSLVLIAMLGADLVFAWRPGECGCSFARRPAEAASWLVIQAKAGMQLLIVIPSKAGGAFQPPHGWSSSFRIAGCRLEARVPPTRRAFRLPAGSRVTFLLLAQEKSNPKRMA